MRKNTKWRQIVRAAQKRRLAPRIALHFAMGAALGMMLGLCLLYFDVANIRDVIEGSYDPNSTRTAFGAVLAMQFGIGAALTGFVLELERA
jgi:hypothetical protein